MADKITRRIEKKELQDIGFLPVKHNTELAIGLATKKFDRTQYQRYTATYCVDEGVLAVVNMDGNVWVAKDAENKRSFLELSGFSKAKFKVPLVDGEQFVNRQMNDAWEKAT